MLLEQIAQHGRYPDMARRFCTSDHKTTKIRAALTPLIRQRRRELGRAVRVLNVLGLRAEESNSRAARPAYSVTLGRPPPSSPRRSRRMPVRQPSPAHELAVCERAGGDDPARPAFDR